MGIFLTYHLAGGKAGMKHMLEQFGPALKLPWTKLKAPKLSKKLSKRITWLFGRQTSRGFMERSFAYSQ